MTGAHDTFPRQSARTQRFTLGAPRDITVAPDGRRVAFLRSGGPEDPVTALWALDLPGGAERCVADPRSLLADEARDLPAAERARRERARESAAGITAYALDAAHRRAAAALAGRLVVADLDSGDAALVDVPGPVVDPRPDPTGERVAWHRDGALWVCEIEQAASARELVGEREPTVRWGIAEFVAAEEMDRHRGFWWAPDGRALLVTRVDEDPVDRWWIADAAHPDHAPAEVRYPAAGTRNADVSAWLVDLERTRVEVRWDRDRWPYLVDAGWDRHGPFVLVQTRDQRALELRTVDATSGATAAVRTETDDAWVERAPGTPVRLDDGRFVTTSDAGGARQLLLDGTAVTPPDLEVRRVAGVEGETVLFVANPIGDATTTDVFRWTASSGSLEQLTPGDGVHGAAAGGGTVVIRTSSLRHDGAITTVVGGPTLASSAATPLVSPRPSIAHRTERRLATALLVPHDHDDTPLPVLLDPYGGPHAQRVVRARGAFSSSQWFADQGFAVVVVDGRGTPGRGAAWDRAVEGDLATRPLDDQIDALHSLARDDPRLDLDRVAIRGWSFGGYLAALAVLRRPDVVHAAIAGAPVTDWRLYDTFYTERYLGLPQDEPQAYERSSLLDEAHRLERPLLLIHGLADDNVVAAHTLRLSSALLSAGRPHQVLPLTGVTHMASQEDVAENLLLLQLHFLREALTGRADAPPERGVEGGPGRI